MAERQKNIRAISEEVHTRFFIFKREMNAENANDALKILLDIVTGKKENVYEERACQHVRRLRKEAPV